jgi:addiction module RelE/StbE family toxin
MGYQVIWTDQAIDDLREIVAFISKDNPAAAVKLGEALIRKSVILAEHPRLGRMFRKMAKDTLRELIVPPYRLIYEINDAESAIYVRLLWHGARREPEIG